MDRERLRALLQIEFFIAGLSICSIVYQPRDLGEFVFRNRAVHFNIYDNFS